MEGLEGRLFMASDPTSPLDSFYGPLTTEQLQISLAAASTASTTRPTVSDTNPADGATGVRRDIFVDANVRLPTSGAGIDTTTLNSSTVMLYRAADRVAVPTRLNTSGGGDSITLTPTVALEANTVYTFEVTEGLRDTSGAAFVPFTMSFTTGTQVTPVDPSVAFEKVTLPTTFGSQYTALTIGPDGRLYAGTITGLIHRFSINPDGTLTSPQVIDTVLANNGGPRMLTGLEFDPRATAANLVLWVTHGHYVTDNGTLNWNAPDFTGKVSLLGGANLQTYTDYVVNLPRSVRDHLTNQMDFGPDGALYLSQASNSAMGAPDNAWGMRPERLLSATVLRLDTATLANRIAAGQGALDAKTPDGGGTFDPWAANSPLTIYATGVRNAYDLIWHSNGRLYAPANGSAAHGAAPGYTAGTAVPRRVDRDLYGPGPYPTTSVSAIPDVLMTEPDFLFLVEQYGYYGHPNPLRGEYVLNGGNPTTAVDPLEVDQYPVGTLPDRNYRGAAYVFGRKLSPNGVVEYSGPAFNGALNGRLLVTRFAGGDDIVALRVAADGSIVDEPETTITGLTGFVDPLDLALDHFTGNLYVSEYDEKLTGAQRITLLRPIAQGADVNVAQQRMYFNARQGTQGTAEQVVVRNVGSAPLAISPDGLRLIGTDAAMYRLVNPPTSQVTIPAGGSLVLNVAFRPASSTAGSIRTATLEVRSNDPDTPVVSVSLRGLSTLGTGGQNEPSLQRILDLYQIPLNVGDANPSNTDLLSAAEPLLTTNDEIFAQRLVKAGDGDVTIEPIAVFGVSSTPALRFGWYDAGTRDAKTELFTIPLADAQSVSPTAVGTTSFDPGAKSFGVYSNWPGFASGLREVFSEDSLNALEPQGDFRHKVRFYPLKNADGSVVPNAYVMAHEEFVYAATDPYTNWAYDNQDLVAIIRNVRPAPSGPEVGTVNLDGAPYHDRFVFNRVQVQPPKLKRQYDPVTQTFYDYQPPNNVVHDTATLRVNNTGSTPLTVHSLVLSNTTGWTLVNPPAAGTQIPAGGFLDVTIRFIAQTIPAEQQVSKENQTVGAVDGTTRYTDGGVWTGTLTVNTSDADEPSTVIQLAGWWQRESELNQEPTLEVLVNRMFGYDVRLVNPGQSMYQTGARNTPLGEEVLSAYWQRADSTRPVTVRQLVAFHSQGATETLRRYTKPAAGATPSYTTVFTHDGVEGQSLLPHLNDGSGAFASGSFSHSGLFGFRVSSTHSDDALNPQELPGGGYGHKLRFYPLRDRVGRIVPDAWLMVHDYYSTDPNGVVNSNFDFQDNIFIVTNVRPGVDAPQGLSAASQSDGIRLDWNDNTEPALAGYNVYRRVATTGSFVKLNGQPITASLYVDGTAAVGTSYEYRVTAVSSFGSESAFLPAITAVRTEDTVAPGAPAGLVAVGETGGIRLSWAPNGEADLAGYRVYRAASVDGPSSLLNTSSLVTGTSFLDTTAPAGQIWFYKVAARDNTGNESAPSAAASAERHVEDLPPTAPAQFTATGGFSGIVLRWAANGESDVAGYNVFRGPAGGPFVKLNGNLINGLTFTDAAAPAGTTWTYLVTAVDVAGHESSPSSATAQRPSTSAPTVQVSGASQVNEGSVYELTLGPVTYAGTQPVTGYVVHWGDGTSETFTTPGVKSHVFADGTLIRDISVDLVDPQATYAGAGTGRVTVNDVAPTVTATPQVASVAAGVPLTLAVSAEDPGADAVASWTIDWGDGRTETFTAGQPVTHVYTAPGTFVVRATATNEDGGFRAADVSVTVTEATPQEPGTTPQNPIDAGALRRRRRLVLRDALNSGKPQLFYRVTVEESVRILAQLGGLRGNVDLELWDASGNVIARSTQPKRRAERINVPLRAGVYLVRVTYVDTVAPQTPFRLNLLGRIPLKRDGLL